MSDELTIAIEAAKKGAEKALYYFHNQPKVTIKPDNSPVTIADKETEQIIISTIKKSFPNARFLGEESGGDEKANELWIIDPIDGTKNFVRSIKSWSILIAYVRNGIAQIGVSYAPALNELVYAERNKGAFLNEKKIHVSSVTELADAYISHGELRYFKNLPGLINLSSAVAAEMMSGDAISYHQLASGHIDTKIDASGHAWDFAPFSIIAEEAGGKVSQMNGDPWSIYSLDFVATNGLLHDKVIEILNGKR